MFHIRPLILPSRRSNAIPSTPARVGSALCQCSSDVSKIRAMPVAPLLATTGPGEHPAALAP